MSGKPSKIDKNVETEQIPPPTEIFFSSNYFGFSLQIKRKWNEKNILIPGCFFLFFKTSQKTNSFIELGDGIVLFRNPVL